MTEQRTGQCLCGGVKLRVSLETDEVAACHCNMCRTWGGGPLIAFGAGTEVAFEGENLIKRYDSSEWAERGFCGRCGTHLFYRLKSNGQHYLPLGLLDDASGLTLGQELFVEECSSAYSFAQDTRKITGEELFAMMGDQA